jgi:hypothetical protein
MASFYRIYFTHPGRSTQNVGPKGLLRLAVEVTNFIQSHKGKKGKVVPLRSIEAHLGDRRYSSYSFLTSALEGGEWSASRPGRPLPPGKEHPVPIVQEAGLTESTYTKAHFLLQ